MDSGKLAAINAYRNQLRMMQQSVGAESAPEESGPSFAHMVGSALKEAKSTVYTADAAKMQAITDRIDLPDLVTAVADAELTLNTIVAVRDRVIGAYQEIARMTI